MKFLLFLFLAAGLKAAPEVQAGAILFQDSQSEQSQASQLATHSKGSHCGLALAKDGEIEVLEAVGPVRFTELKKWIARGKEGRYAVRRLKQGALPQADEIK